MEFQNKAPRWDNAGTMPSEELLANGFVAGYKPPAPYFNYMFHIWSACIEELQKAVSSADGEIGDLSTLSTTLKTSLVVAINELFSNTGKLSKLTTAEKASIVGAINELVSKTNIGTFGTNITDLDIPLGLAGYTTYVHQFSSAALNSPIGSSGFVFTYVHSTSVATQYSFHLNGKIFVRKKTDSETIGAWKEITEDLSALKTKDKSSLVNALNEVLNRTANDMKVKSLIGGTKIENGTDLNTILTVGNYHCISDADAKTFQNCPIGNAFCMTVGYPTGQNAYLYQELIHYTTGTRYYRECLVSSAIWTSWVKTIDTTSSLSELNGTLPIEKGGTGAATVDGAVNALLVKPIIDANNKVNANTLVKTGIYRVYFDDTAFDPVTLNIPMRYGIILVEGYSSYWTQTAIDVSTGNFYHRSSSNTGSTWKEWSTVYTTRYKPTANDVGAVPSGMVTNKFTVKTNEAIDSAFTSVFSSMPDNSTKVISMFVDASGLSIAGGGWHFIVNRTTATYGAIFGICYSVDSMKMRFLQNGTLSAWKNVVEAAGVNHKHTKSEITDFPTSMTPTAHNQGASTITAGTFAGQVVANSSGQTPSISLLRNSKLVSAETNPTVNGEINWTYK